MARPVRQSPRLLRSLLPLSLLAVLFLALPLAGLLQGVRWTSLISDLATPQAREALGLSLLSSLLATALALLLGLPLAWSLARDRFPGRQLVRALVILPMVLPPVVGGLALLGAYGRSGGLIGGWLYQALGVQLTFSLAGVVVAQAFVALPFLVLAVEGGLRAIDPRYEQAAATLGAAPLACFLRVTLRLLLPSLAAGTALAWARALGEFGATITFAGNIEGRTQTAPLAVYLLLETQPTTAYALSFALVLVSLAVIIGLRGRWWSLGR